VDVTFLQMGGIEAIRICSVYYCQDPITSVSSLGSTRKMQVEGHPREGKPQILRESGHNRRRSCDQQINVIHAPK
jgi:hypothetical protein